MSGTKSRNQPSINTHDGGVIAMHGHSHLTVVNLIRVICLVELATVHWHYIGAQPLG